MSITYFGDQKVIDRLQALKPLLSLYIIIYETFYRIYFRFFKFRYTPISIKKYDGEATNVAILTLIGERSDLKRLIIDLKIAGYKVLLIYNTLNCDMTCDFIELADYVYKKRNSGRDFGGYIEATKILYNNPNKIKKVLYVNDSCLYLKPGIEVFKKTISSTKDFVSLTDSSVDGVYTAHSYYFQLSDKVMYNKYYKKYILHFIHYNSGNLIVKYGEKKLAKLILHKLNSSHETLFPYNYLNILNDEKHHISRQLIWLGSYASRPTGLGTSYTVFDEMLKSNNNNNNKRYLKSKIQPVSFQKFDLSQQLSVPLFNYTKYPFIKKNSMSRGFISFEATKYVDSDFLSELQNESLKMYGSIYSSTGINRIIKIAKLWSYI